MSISRPQLARVNKALYTFYLADDPQPSKISIFKGSVKVDEDDPTCYNAMVQIESDWIKKSPKAHRVHIKFRLTKTGQLDSKSITYL